MLAYIVDANTGRSSTATAVNSFFRGLSAFIGTELAVPIQVGSHLSYPPTKNSNDHTHRIRWEMVCFTAHHLDKCYEFD
jgi:hypothetical protein